MVHLSNSVQLAASEKFGRMQQECLQKLQSLENTVITQSIKELTGSLEFMVEDINRYVRSVVLRKKMNGFTRNAWKQTLFGELSLDIMEYLPNMMNIV